MLHNAVMLHSNFLHLVTLSRTGLVTRRTSQQCYITVLHYGVTLYVCSHLYFITEEDVYYAGELTVLRHFTLIVSKNSCQRVSFIEPVLPV